MHTHRKGLVISVDDWLRFKTTETVGVVFKHLRQEINRQLLTRIETTSIGGEDTHSEALVDSGKMVSLVKRLLEIEAAYAD